MKPSLSRLCRLSFCIFSSFLATGKIAIAGQPDLTWRGDLSVTQAQVTPDNSGIDTQVNQNGNAAEITGGQTRGTNLFHSFQDFSVPTGNEASFNNAGNISNIFGRVTGGNISNIDGAIRANGSANLFLINPAGIVFGENARLDIGGSFYGSSASSILFEDGEFDAADLENPPLLTVNAPIGLGFRDNPGEIVNRSIAANNNEPVGLEVAPGSNLALVGGNVNFERGKVTIRGGNIELGGLLSSGTVGFNPDGSLSFADLAKADVSLSNAAEINVTGANGGNININARNLNLEAGEFGESIITRAVVGDTASAESQSGNITINAAEDVTVDNSRITNRVLPRALGNSGKIAIATNNLILTNGGEVNASTIGQGNAGLVSINADDSIIIDGENADGNYSGILSAVATPASGNSGGITITTSNLSLSNGGEVNASTAGQGNAGAIDITASDTITVDGERSDGNPSSILSAVASVASGDSEGINITTTNLVLTNGGTVNASTVGIGNTGLVNIFADNDIIIDGKTSNRNSASGILSAVVPEASGNSEGIDITTSNLTLTNRGIITVSSFGEGNAGRLTVRANSLSLENNSSISALTQSGLGGLVNLQIAENITLKNNSRITARALGEANGGNINIDTNFIIAFADGNNDIIANAQQGDGGNITVNARALFGIEERPLNDESNDINAGSTYSLDGNVSVNTPDVNLVQEATELVDNIILPSEQTIAEVCSNRKIASNRFTVRGKGGIPGTPDLPLDSRNIIISNNNTSDNSTTSSSVETQQGKIQPAKGIKTTKYGEIILTAYPTDRIGARIIEAKANCGV